MNRINEIEIAGKLYPLNFSMSLAEKMAEKYGCVEDVWTYIQGRPYKEMIDEFIWILSLLIQQGCEYKKIMENESIEPLSLEKLKVCMSISEIVKSQDIIMETLVTAMNPEIELEEIKKKASVMAQKWTRQVLHGQSTTATPSVSHAMSTELCL